MTASWEDVTKNSLRIRRDKWGPDYDLALKTFLHRYRRLKVFIVDFGNLIKMAVSGQIASPISSLRSAVNRFAITADESNQRGVVKQSRSLFKMTATGNKIKERSNSGGRHSTNPGLKAWLCVCVLSLSLSLFWSHTHLYFLLFFFFKMRTWKRGHYVSLYQK